MPRTKHIASNTFDFPEPFIPMMALKCGSLCRVSCVASRSVRSKQTILREAYGTCTTCSPRRNLVNRKGLCYLTYIYDQLYDPHDRDMRCCGEFGESCCGSFVLAEMARSRASGERGSGVCAAFARDLVSTLAAFQTLLSRCKIKSLLQRPN
jgi:hypothetical protein